MQPKKLTPDLSVMGQLSVSDIADVKARGFRSIICNRPDGEGSDQPLFADVEKAAKAEGIEAIYIPVTTGMVKDEQAAQFAKALAELPKPVLAYCRSGARSTTLWALGRAGQQPIDEIVAAAATAGYDLSGVANRITK